MKRLKLVAGAAVLLSSSTALWWCGRRALGETIYASSESPDGKHRIEVLEPRVVGNPWFRVVYRSASRVLKIADAGPNEGLAGLVIVEWNSNSEKVVVLACNEFNGRPVLAGLDLRDFTALPSSQVHEWIGESLRRQYNGAAKADVDLKWACGFEGRDAYRRRHTLGGKARVSWSNEGDRL